MRGATTYASSLPWPISCRRQVKDQRMVNPSRSLMRQVNDGPRIQFLFSFFCGPAPKVLYAGPTEKEKEIVTQCVSDSEEFVAQISSCLSLFSFVLGDNSSLRSYTLCTHSFCIFFSLDRPSERQR